jgi:hypothetical protein
MMSDNILNKVYYNIIRIFQHHDKDDIIDYKPAESEKSVTGKIKTCPITGLDISMQPKNSKFLSYTGVKWYYNNDFETYKNILEPKLKKSWKYKPLKDRFKEIAHIVRNKDSNPRNNIRRILNRILSDNNTLFNNQNLIDKNKLKKAGINFKGTAP